MAAVLGEHAFLPDHQVKYLIATVPDPDGNAPRLYTDRVIDMILLAASSNGYFLLQHAIPWRFATEKMDEEYAKRQEQLKDLAAMAEDPGVLVFEREHQMLVIFPVPESPTSGIRREPLTRAANFLAEREARAGIIRPTFTGSLHSLDEWLGESPAHRGRVSRIVSGTVMGLRPGDVTMDAGILELRYPHLAAKGFEWLLQQQSQTRRVLGDFLSGTRWHRDGVLDLVEDSTGFGRAAALGSTITFPWQISRVRNAMPELSLSKSHSNNFALPLLLRDLRPAGSVPMYAPEQTPADLELVLAQVISRVERAKQDYVYIKATDVLDSLFLSRLLRAATPTQRILAMQPDLMFLRTEDQHAAAGLLTPATFPLSSHLRFEQKFEPTYDSQISAGVHYAASLLIRQDTYGKVGRAIEPPQWVEALGRSGYWPIAQIAPYTVRPPCGLIPETPSLIWVALFGCGLLGVTLWFAAVLASQGSASDLAILPRWTGAADRARSLAALNFVLSLGLLGLSIPVWVPHQTRSPETVLYLAGVIAILFAGAWVTWWLCAPAGLWRAAGLVPALIALAAALARNAPDPYLVRQFLVVRSQDPLNGVNPSVPVVLLLAGIFGCAWSHHQRTVILTERSIDLGLLDAPPSAELDKPGLAHWLLSLGVGAIVAAGGGIFLHSLEPIAYDWLVSALAGVLAGSAVFSALSLHSVWVKGKRLLDRIEMDDLRFEVTAIEPEEKGVPVWESQLRCRSFFFYARLREVLAASEGEWQREQAARIADFLTGTQGRDGGTNRASLEADLAGLAHQWSQTVPATEREHSLRSRFLSLRLAQYLRAMFLIWRARITAMSAGFMSLTLALNSYVFGPERLIQALSFLLLLGLGAVAVQVFLQMDQHPMLSKLSGTAPGTFNVGVWSKILSVGALPALSLLASYTPALGRIISAYVQPALEVMTK